MAEIHIKAENNEMHTLKEWAECFKNRITAAVLAENHWKFNAYGLTVLEGFPMCALTMKDYIVFLEREIIKRKVGIVIELVEDPEVTV